MHQQAITTVAMLALALSAGLIQSQKCTRRDIRDLKEHISTKISTSESEVKNKIEALAADFEGEIGKLSGKMSVLESMIETGNVNDESSFESMFDHLADLGTKLGELTANKDCILAPDGASKIRTKSGKQVEANCDDGWLVIAYRFNGKVNFDRTWKDYQNGFGSRWREYFVGFDAILSILEQGEYTLLFDLLGWKNERGHAEYATFSLSDETSGYKLNVTGYNFTGTSNIDDYFSGLNGRPFRTMDHDNEDDRCPEYRRGPWWHGKGSCGDSNLFSVYANGPVCERNYACMFWYGFPSDTTKFPPYPLDYSLKEMKMKIRPRFTA